MYFLFIFFVGVIQTIFASLWYSPLLFGKFWMKVNGIPENATKEEMKELSKGVGIYYGIQFALQLVTNTILFFLINYTNRLYASLDSAKLNQIQAYVKQDLFIISPSYAYVLFAILIWIGFLLPVVIQNELWTKSSNSMKVKKTLVVGGQLLISTVIAALMFHFLGSRIGVDMIVPSFF
jgi:Protein of unknown function (DUF1761)